MTRTQCHTCDVLVKHAFAWGNDAAPDPEQKIILQNSIQPFSTVPERIETPYQWVEKLMQGKDRVHLESRFSGRTGYCEKQGNWSITFVLFLNFFFFVYAGDFF